LSHSFVTFSPFHRYAASVHLAVCCHNYFIYFTDTAFRLISPPVSSEVTSLLELFVICLVLVGYVLKPLVSSVDRHECIVECHFFSSQNVTLFAFFHAPNASLIPVYSE